MTVFNSKTWGLFRRSRADVTGAESPAEVADSPDATELPHAAVQDRPDQEAATERRDEYIKSVLESFRSDDSHHPMSLSTTCSEVVDNFRPVAEAKSISLRVDVRLDPSIRFVTDAGRVRQIVANLMANAIRYTDRGTVTLHVDIVGQTHDEATVQITVTDTGIGIPAAKLASVLSLAAHPADSAARRYGGVGGGLRNCVECVQRLGGTIEAESRQGEGSRFIVELVLKTQLEMEHAAAASSQDLRGLHVLVVEDNAVNQLILRRILEQQGCKVDIAANGLLGVEWLASHGCDVVLMDCHMPEMDGFEATRRIRQFSSAARHIPIIAVTANAMSGDREACLQAGMNDYISKPVRREALTHAISRLVRAG